MKSKSAMKTKYNFMHFIVGCFFVVFLWNCTDSSLDSDNTISKNTIRGQVELSDHLSPEDVHVWFKVFGISTRTDENGAFELTLPPAAQQGGGGSDGIFNLYFYMANYQLDSVEVVLFNGSIQASNRVKRDGELVEIVQLAKLLDIKNSFSEDQEGSITIIFTVEAKIGVVNISADFSNPESQGDPQYIVGFVRKIDPDQDFCLGIYRENRTHRTGDFQIENHPTELFPLEIINKSGMFTPGEYEVIPSLVIHQEIPSGLLESLGNTADACHKFFNVPLRINNNRFQVSPGSGK